MTEAFHKYLYSTNLTRKGLSNLLHRGEPKAHRVTVWFCAEIHRAGKWQLAIDSCSTLLYPLQCSCLENPRDRGAWWAAVYGVPLSQTRLKRLSSSSYTTLALILLFSSQPETYPCLCSLTSPFNIWHFLFLIYFLFIYLFAVLDLSCCTCGLGPWPGIEPGPPALGAWSPSHWTTRKVPTLYLLFQCFSQYSKICPRW